MQIFSGHAVERSTLLRAAVVAGLLAGCALSHTLWVGSRLYPLTPVWPSLRWLGPPVDSIAFGLLVASLIALAVAPRREVLAAAITLLLLVAVQDQSRWQPWFYQYALLLLAIGARDSSSGNALNTCSLIVLSTYVWSGLGKLNSNFVGHIFPWLVEPLVGRRLAHAEFIHHLAPAVAVLELSIGLALLSKRLRRAALFCAIAMHVFILFAIGPLGHGSNPVVWPWNCVMIASLLILFYKRSDDPGPLDILWLNGRPFHIAVLILVGLMPALSFLDLWDHYLSSALYTGNRNSGTIYFSDDVFDRLPAQIQDFVTDEGNGVNGLDVEDWSYGELSVPAYPEVRIYRNVLSAICSYRQGPSAVKMVIEHKQSFVRRQQPSVYYCPAPGRWK